VTIHTFEKILGEHPFFKDLSEPHLDTVVGCVANVVFQPGEFIFREGRPPTASSSSGRARWR